jgi:hypothetical protein
MRSLALVVVLVGTAAAKPLPDGLKVFVDKGRPMASRSGMIVPLRDDSISDYDRLLDAHLSDDGSYLVIRADRCKGMLGEPDEAMIALAQVDARIDNALGMAKHLKKEFADAMPRFQAAVAKDPLTPMYATNLLSAQSLAKKLDDADQTIAALAQTAAPWLAWRLSVDPELANVKGRASAKAVVAAKPGHLKAKDIDLNGTIGYSPVGGGFFVKAVTTYSGGGPPGGYSLELGFASIATGREVLRLLIAADEDLCGEDHMLPKCTGKQLAAVAKRQKVADALLASLGFEAVEGEMKSLDELKEVETTDDMVTVTRGKATRKLPLDRQRVRSAAVLPQGVVLDLDRRHMVSCDDQGGVLSIGAVALP